MSYQFDDESALEELLNQQLDRSRQQANDSGRSTRPLTGEIKPKTPSSIPQRPSSGSNAASRNRLADWLNSNQDEEERETEAKTSIPSKSVQFSSGIEPSGSSSRLAKRLESDKDKREKKTRDQDLLDQYGNEAALQQMSKQRLVQVILEELVPSIQLQLNLSASMTETELRLKQLEGELDRERTKAESLQREQEERLRLTEASWVQLNKQLNYRVELYEKELSDTIERNNSNMIKLHEEHRRQLESMSKNYEARLVEQKSQFDEESKRRQAIHELEMSSRLRVGGELSKLDSIFSCWHETIETTIKQLESQFKSVELLLDKQTVTIRSSNDAISERSQATGELGERLEAKAAEFDRISKLILNLIERLEPKLSHFDQVDSLLQDVSDKLSQLTDQNRKLEARQVELAQREREFESFKFSTHLEAKQLEHQTNHLNEIIESNRIKTSHLNEREKQFDERNRELDSKSAQLDKRQMELQQDGEKLDSERRRLTNKERELSKWQDELAKERRFMRRQLKQVNHYSNRLSNIKLGVQKELNQLRRLQSSIVCSICLERLCRTKGDGVYESNDLTSDYKASDKNNNNNKWMKTDVDQMRRVIEAEWRELARECKYVNFLTDTKSPAVSQQHRTSD